MLSEKIKEEREDVSHKLPASQKKYAQRNTCNGVVQSCLIVLQTAKMVMSTFHAVRLTTHVKQAKVW